jgi:RND superfamily putative drug exporter
VDGVTGVRPVAARDGATLLAVGYTGGAVEAAARDAVTTIRALPAPAGATVDVGGVSAQQVDLRASIARTLPWMALLVVAATFLLLFLAFGSLVLPLKAVVMNVLSLGAAFGVVTWIFQDGNLSGLLGFTSTGTVETTQPILMLAILFGLSMDYEVFLLSRIREEWDATGDNTAAVAAGLQRTGRIITSAALLLVVVIAAFSTSGITFIKLIGVGMAVAIVIDATVVRALLVPATMRLLGRANWWAPAPMVRWWERYGVRESDGPVPGPRTAGLPAAPDRAPERVA